MAKFCNQCGRPLAEGEVCICQQGTAKDNGKDEWEKGRQKDVYQKEGEEKKSDDTYTISTEDWIPIRKLIGFHEGEANDVQGCFERNKKIVPELVAPCEQEITVKQYEICNARSRLRGLWQEGRVQVTNKRILFRLSGRSWIGKAMEHTEFSIDEVAGLDISNGVRFALWDFFLAIMFALLMYVLGGFIGQISAVLGVILGLVPIVFFFAVKKKYFYKFSLLGLGLGAASLAMTIQGMYRNNFLYGFLLALMVMDFALFVVALILFSLKPSLSIQIKTKCASDAPIYIWSHQTMASVMEVLPGRDADLAMEELGAMISDIQKFGDFGIQKWKED